MIKRENIFIPRIGAKDNYIKSFIKFLPLDVLNVIEPFGGSFALCRRIYHNVKYNKIVNDLDPGLFYAYTHQEELQQLMNDSVDLYNKSDKNMKQFKLKLYELHANKDLVNYFIDSRIYSGRFKVASLKSLDYSKQIEFNKTITFRNENYINLIEEHKTNPQSFIFLDPPYLFSDNSGYYPQAGCKDMTNILIVIKQYIEDPTVLCKIMLIINELDIIRYLFRDNIKGIYNKTYGISKKKMNHLIITNY